MPIIRKGDLKVMNKQELMEKMEQLRFEILKLRVKKGQATSGTKRIKEIKKTIARIHAKLNNLK